MPKRIIPLSDAEVRKAKPQTKEVKMYDGGGLYLLLTPSGGKLWRLKYSFDGKERMLCIGAYPAITLIEARKVRDDVKAQLAKNIDPRVIKVTVEQIESPTFESVAREWHQLHAHEWDSEFSKLKLHKLEKHIFSRLILLCHFS